MLPPCVKDLYCLDNLHVLKKARARMASSYDRRGGNFDFGNFEDIAGDEALALDADGPGVITRIWSANPAGRIRLFRGEDHAPLLDEDFADFLRQSPLRWGNGTKEENPQAREGAILPGDKTLGYTSYLPIPFSERLRVHLSPIQALYYQINYTQFEQGPPSLDLQREALFTEPERYAPVRKQWAWTWEDIASQYEVEKRRIDLSPGEKKDIFHQKGRAIIKAIRVTVPWPETPRAAEHLKEKLLFRGYWDKDAVTSPCLGEGPPQAPVHPSPSIQAPLAAFFMDMNGLENYASALIQKNGNAYACRFPMPFQQEGRLSLHNASILPVENVQVEIVWEPLSE